MQCCAATGALVPLEGRQVDIWIDPQADRSIYVDRCFTL